MTLSNLSTLFAPSRSHHSRARRMTAIGIIATLFFGFGAGYSPSKAHAQESGAGCIDEGTWFCPGGDPLKGTARTGQTDDRSGQCMGACGPGCTANCGGGGFCGAHDSCVAQYGMYAVQCDAIFPLAAVQWAACEVGRAVVAIAAAVVHVVTQVVKAVTSFLGHLFN